MSKSVPPSPSYQSKTEHTVRHKVPGALALNYQVCGHSVITGAPKI